MRQGSVEFKKISRATARRLVISYDKALLEQTLGRLKEKAIRGDLRNPVGFFITLMRCEKS